MGQLVLGVKSVYHTSSACLLDGSGVVAFWLDALVLGDLVVTDRLG